MDARLRSLLRKYTYTHDPEDAVAFANNYIRAQGDPDSKTNEFYEAWWWLQEHPAFQRESGTPGFFEALDMSVQKVNPATGSIDDDKSLNIQTEIWLEVGPWLIEDEMDLYENITTAEVPSHDYNLDCGGLTYEDAIIKMAALVKHHYGDYRFTRQQSSDA